MKSMALIYEPCELEIIKFETDDLILTSGTLDFDGDGENQGPPSDSWT